MRFKIFIYKLKRKNAIQSISDIPVYWDQCYLKVTKDRKQPPRYLSQSRLMILGNDSLFWEVTAAENRSATHTFSAWSAFAASANVNLTTCSVCRRLGSSRGHWAALSRRREVSCMQGIPPNPELLGRIRTHPIYSLFTGRVQLLMTISAPTEHLLLGDLVVQNWKQRENRLKV